MISAASRSSALRKWSRLQPDGNAEARCRMKHFNAGERLALEAAREFFDVDLEAGQRLRHVAHDARPLLADDFQRDEPPGLFGLSRCAPLDGDAQA